eukprot:gb/GECG01005723.1/.p1 GENE.gb/GECG01005723.1/~~gb/GECG01005723.1/.p1  ORF type:complete len:733 (+),score=64.27 gb/GECG01005723.1/:1-2199(+)
MHKRRSQRLDTLRPPVRSTRGESKARGFYNEKSRLSPNQIEQRRNAGKKSVDSRQKQKKDFAPSIETAKDIFKEEGVSPPLHKIREESYLCQRPLKQNKGIKETESIKILRIYYCYAAVCTHMDPTLDMDQAVEVADNLTHVAQALLTKWNLEMCYLIMRQKPQRMGHLYKLVGSIVGVSKDSVQRVIETYEASEGEHFYSSNPGGRPSKRVDKYGDTVEKIVDDTNDRYGSVKKYQILAQLRRKYPNDGLKMCHVHKILTSRGFIYARPKPDPLGQWTPYIQHRMKKYITNLFNILEGVKGGKCALVFSDESWIQVNKKQTKTWVRRKNRYIKGGNTNPGSRLVLLHAFDWNKGPLYSRDSRGKRPKTTLKDRMKGPLSCELVFRSDGPGNYKRNMQGNLYLDWFVCRMIPVLENLYPQKPVYLILDNAGYHNRVPSGTKTPANCNWEDLKNLWETAFGKDFHGVEMIIKRKANVYRGGKRRPYPCTKLTTGYAIDCDLEHSGTNAAANPDDGVICCQLGEVDVPSYSSSRKRKRTSSGIRGTTASNSPQNGTSKVTLREARAWTEAVWKNHFPTMIEGELDKVIRETNDRKGFSWLNIIFQPPNSPVANASELMWLYIKEKVRAGFELGETADDVLERAQKVMYGDPSEHTKGYTSYDKIMKWQNDFLEELSDAVLDRKELRSAGIARDEVGRVCIHPELRESLISTPKYFNSSSESFMDEFWNGIQPNH